MPRDHTEVAMQRELVERARRGDHDAFAVLVDMALTRLDAVARLILHETDQAEDAVQEALVRAWRDLPTLRDPDRFDAWLHRLLVRCCMDEARRGRRHRHSVSWSPDHEPVGVDTAGSILDRDQLDRGFRRLTPNDRALIVLHHYLDLPLTDVATIVGVPLGTAKSRLHRALERMRASLEADARTLPDVAEGRLA
jgi:RNA polymerase sigma factor (sigma-70 family)